MRPALPTIMAAELTCLSDAAYERLATRNRLQRQYAEALEVIIKSTHSTSSGQAHSTGSGQARLLDTPGAP